MRNKRNKSKIKEIFLSHIERNKREYFIVIVLFFIGFLLGILFINHVNETQKEQISSYINQFVENIKQGNIINKGALLKQSIGENILLVVILWFAGMSVIGMPIVYAIIAFRGFCFSYTIAAMIASLGTQKGIILAFSAIFLQSILFIPIILALAVSGMKLYQSIMKDRRKENIKIEICRHTLFSFIMCMGLVLSSFIEVYLSSNLVLFISGWF